MSKPDPEVLLNQIRNAPRRVKRVSTTANLIGLTIAVRAIWIGYTGQVSMGRAVFYCVLLFATYSFLGMWVAARIRPSYVILAALASLQLIVSLAWLLHLLALAVTSRWRDDPRQLFTGAIAVPLLSLVIYLFADLFSKDVRTWVWRPGQTGSTDEPKGQEGWGLDESGRGEP